jgi:hypothetical protein
VRLRPLIRFFLLTRRKNGGPEGNRRGTDKAEEVLRIESFYDNFPSTRFRTRTTEEADKRKKEIEMDGRWNYLRKPCSLCRDETTYLPMELGDTLREQAEVRRPDLYPDPVWVPARYVCDRGHEWFEEWLNTFTYRNAFELRTDADASSDAGPDQGSRTVGVAAPD